MLSIGYQGLRPERLREIVDTLGLTVIDVRSSRNTRCAGFGSRQLETLLGDRYRWEPRLGGRTTITDDALAWLRDREAEGETLLLCCEPGPWDCHRHLAIAARLLPELDVAHIVGDDVFLASSVQAAIQAAGSSDDLDVEIACSLTDLLSLDPK
jgi:hypothetical protein